MKIKIVLLLICMIFFPINVYGATGDFFIDGNSNVRYTSLQAAVNAARNGDIIRIEADVVTISESILIENKDISICSYGYNRTIRFKGNLQGACITVKNASVNFAVADVNRSGTGFTLEAVANDGSPNTVATIIKLEEGATLNLNINMQLKYGKYAVVLDTDATTNNKPKLNMNYNSEIFNSANGTAILLNLGEFVMNDEAKLYGYYGQNNVEGNIQPDSFVSNTIEEAGALFEYSVMNTSSAVNVGTNSKFILNSGYIYGFNNSRSSILVDSDGYFEMNGGYIFNNVCSAAGGAICLTDSSRINSIGGTMIMNGGIIKNNTANYGGGIRVEFCSYLEINSGEISYNFAITGGGGIRVVASNCIMNGGKIHHNISGGTANGGGIGVTWSEDFGIINDVIVPTVVEVLGGKIYSNVSYSKAGGIAVISNDKQMEDQVVTFVTISNASIYDNQAYEEGGGVIVGFNASVNIEKKATIYENHSDVAGGGIYVGEGIMTVGESSIYNNSAQNGAAIFVGNIEENAYQSTLVIQEGCYIYENIASENGGGVYTQNCIINILGGKIYDNSAQNGAAIYCFISDIIMNNGSIENCIATNNGGAIYLSDGDFLFNGGRIGGIDSDKKLGNKAIHGGAAYISGGNFTMNGGTIEGNTATESGGAIQISNGNVYITAGKISYNVARGESVAKADNVGYGGGIFVDGGDTVKIEGGEISNNVAAKNGGGIEIKTSKSVTVDVYSGSFIENVADECGGAFGIECDNGVINVGKKDCDGLDTSTHEHPLILENIAGVQGGGFYISGANAKLNIYCGYVDDNTVGSVENNFNQSSGTVTVYEGVQIGDKNEGIIVVGGTFLDERTTNEEKFQIIYYSNFQESADYREALITDGSTITLPGDIFGVADYEIIGWTTDINNKTEVEYEVGDQLTITKIVNLYALWVLEEENEPTFIIIIPAEISINDTKTVLFDLETELNYFPRNKMLKINLGEEDFKLKLLKEDIVIDTLDYKLTKNKDEIESDGVISKFYSDSTLITYNQKEELEINILSTHKYAGNYEDTITFVVAIEEVS